MAKSSVTMRRSIGMVSRTKKPVWMTAVMVNGHTVASFVTPEEAVKWALDRYPKDCYTHDYSVQKG